METVSEVLSEAKTRIREVQSDNPELYDSDEFIPGIVDFIVGQLDSAMRYFIIVEEKKREDR